MTSRRSKAKSLAACTLIIAVAVIGYTLFRDPLPFPRRFVQTCDTAIADRLKDPVSYERTGVQGSVRALSHEEFFADPRRAVAPEHRRGLIGSNQPVRYEALITYQALDAVGAVIQEQANCTFNSLSGGDAPNKTGGVLIDGEYNLDWVKRQHPNSREMFFRILKNS
ncbi:hypothetical protein AB8A31_09860 [Tardiphaga sp. 804_B3_N1_9]|uniref:hypothetical protein n=1 Tax=Tardiphaga TaxID=1395974 RepID=UPI001586EF9E|nr:hypothetical protein [Tardiphaga robiniae]NUU39891.1 hypothetical protein [Tardiphaga robiniae]